MRILVATDESPHALRAAAFAARLVREFREAEVVLVNVGHIPAIALGGMEMVDFSVMEEALEAAGKAILDRTLREFAGLKASATALYRRGDPAQEIITAAREKRADLIVMGSRGRGQLEGLILGSVSERVLHSAQMPVLIVH